jgi:hypothetical protein
MNHDGPAAVAAETTLREDVLDNSRRRDAMGARAARKTEKSQKQHDEKQKQKSKDKFDKQPKRKP